MPRRRMVDDRAVPARGGCDGLGHLGRPWINVNCCAGTP